MLPTIRLEIERWKYNKDYEVYVSTLGRVKNKKKKLVDFKVGDGYIYIQHGKRIIGVHRLVMLTFKPNKYAEALTVDHLDHNKRNNRLSNLEWVTEQENKRRAQRDVINIPKECPKKKEKAVAQPIKKVYTYRCVTYNMTMTEEQTVIAIRTLNKKWANLGDEDILKTIRCNMKDAFGLRWHVERVK